MGIPVQRLIINHVLPVAEGENGFFARRRAMQQPYIAEAARSFPGVAISEVEETFVEIIGVKTLAAFARLLDGRGDGRLPDTHLSPTALLLPNNGGRRRLFFMGKGGVGKTVVSAATALSLARQGVRTLLVTTDPAAHSGRVLGCEAGDAPTAVPGEPNLFVARVDQETAVREYRQRILDESRGRFDAATLAAMEEELNSPCTEEMAAFERFLAYLTDDKLPGRRVRHRPHRPHAAPAVAAVLVGEAGGDDGGHAPRHAVVRTHPGTLQGRGDDASGP